MGNEWPLVAIENIGKVKSGKRLPKGEELVSFETESPYIRLVDVSKGRIESTNLKYLRPETQQKISRYIVNSNDVCLAIVGHTIGMVFYIDDIWDGVNLTENAARITDVSSEFNSRFIYYYLNSPIGQSDILSRIVGSAQGKLPLYNIKSLEIPKPPKIHQDEIAKILSSLDNKIDLNRQMNQTLEKMAQTLFKSWFVDFDPVIDNALDAGNPIPDELQGRAELRKATRKAQAAQGKKGLPEDIRQLFPSEFELSQEPSVGISGWVPKGWVAGNLSHLAELKTKSVHPNREPSKQWFQFSLPAFDLGKIPSQDFGVEIKSGKYWVIENVVLVSKLNPITPRIWLPQIIDECNSVCSTEFMPFEPIKAHHRYYLYSLMCSDNMKLEIQSRVTGTTGSHQRVQPKKIAKLPILLPKEELIVMYSSFTGVIFGKEQENLNVNMKLSKLRDMLLPKLISGELSLDSVEVNELKQTV